MKKILAASTLMLSYVCSQTFAQTTGELIQLASSEAGRETIFSELKKVARTWDDWPHDDDVHKAMLEHFLEVAENPQSPVHDRVTALRGIQNSRILWSGESSPEKKRVDALKTALMDESNPRDVRLSSLLLFNEHHRFEQFESEKAQREFLVAGLKTTKYEHLRSICVQRVTWGAYSASELTDFQSAADTLARIAADPNDWLADESLRELKHVGELVPDLVPQLVKRFDAFKHQREIIRFLGESGSHPRFSLPLLWRVHAKQSERHQKEHSLIAIAKITRANDLDDWHPQYATVEICEILREKAVPLIQLLLNWLQQKTDVNGSDVAAVTRCFANIGPAARQGAIAIKDQIHRFERDDNLKEFIRNLAKAGLGNDLVPIAMNYIDRPAFRYSVIESLGVAGAAADDCVPKLIELIDDEDVQPAALEAIAQMGQRGREATDKLKDLLRREDDRAALALMALYPEDRDTVFMAFKVKRYITPNESAKLEAAMSAQQFDTLKRIVATKLNGETTVSLAKPDVKIAITKAMFGTPGKKTDATQAVQKFVDDKALVKRTAKGLGVKDPKPGVQKRLIIKYTVDGKEYSKQLACGPSKPKINLFEVLIPENYAGPGFAEFTGSPAVKRTSKSTWRLDPHMSIGTPGPGFEWKIASTEPVVYECRKEGSDIWLTVAPMPTINDFGSARTKVLEEYRMKVAMELQADGAEFEDGIQYFTHHGDDSIRGLSAVTFDYSMNDKEYMRFIGRVFRSAGSYQFEISAPEDLAYRLIGIVRYVNLDIDNNKKTPVPDDVREKISAELANLEELFDMKTSADVEKMIEHVFGAEYLNAMKSSGRMPELSKRILEDIGPRTLAAIKHADWEVAVLMLQGSAVHFRAPLHELTFTKVNGEWRLRLR